MHWFKYNGVSSETKHLRIATAPTRTMGQRELESMNLPGINGEFFTSNVRYKNTSRAYSVSMYNPSLSTASMTRAEQLAADLIEWLYPNDTRYHELEDSYDQLHIRMAICSAGTNVENILSEVASASVQFNCKPQVYLKNRWNLIEFGTGSSNNGTGVAYPLIVAERNNASITHPQINVKYNGQTLLTASDRELPYPLTLYIDTETGEVYDQNGSYTYKLSGQLERTYSSYISFLSNLHAMGIQPGASFTTSNQGSAGWTVKYKVRSWTL